MESKNEPFLAVVFPVEKDSRSLAELAKRLVSELTGACAGTPPTMVRPDATALCMLLEGEFRRIDAALSRVMPPDARYLVVRVDAPYVLAGLSTAHAWLQARCRS